MDPPGGGAADPVEGWVSPTDDVPTDLVVKELVAEPVYDEAEAEKAEEFAEANPAAARNAFCKLLTVEFAAITPTFSGGERRKAAEQAWDMGNRYWVDGYQAMQEELAQRNTQNLWAEDETANAKHKQEEIERKHQEAEEERRRQQLEGKERARQAALDAERAKLEEAERKRLAKEEEKRVKEELEARLAREAAVPVLPGADAAPEPQPQPQPQPEPEPELEPEAGPEMAPELDAAKIVPDAEDEAQTACEGTEEPEPEPEPEPAGQDATIPAPEPEPEPSTEEAMPGRSDGAPAPALTVDVELGGAGGTPSETSLAAPGALGGSGFLGEGLVLELEFEPEPAFENVIAEPAVTFADASPTVQFVESGGRTPAPLSNTTPSLMDDDAPDGEEEAAADPTPPPPPKRSLSEELMGSKERYQRMRQYEKDGDAQMDAATEAARLVSQSVAGAESSGPTPSSAKTPRPGAGKAAAGGGGGGGGERAGMMRLQVKSERAALVAYNRALSCAESEVDQMVMVQKVTLAHAVVARSEAARKRRRAAKLSADIAAHGPKIEVVDVKLAAATSAGATLEQQQQKAQAQAQWGDGAVAGTVHRLHGEHIGQQQQQQQPSGGGTEALLSGDWASVNLDAAEPTANQGFSASSAGGSPSQSPVADADASPEADDDRLDAGTGVDDVAVDMIRQRAEDTQESREELAALYTWDVDTSEFNRFVQGLMSECKRRYPLLTGVQRRKLAEDAWRSGARYMERGLAWIKQGMGPGVLAPDEAPPPPEVAEVAPPDSAEEAAMRALYDAVDANSNGTCTRAELVKALRKDRQLQQMLDLPAHIGDSQRGLFEAVFQGMDRDADGQISFDEFRDFLLQRQPSPRATEAGRLLLEDAARGGAKGGGGARTLGGKREPLLILDEAQNIIGVNASEDAVVRALHDMDEQPHREHAQPQPPPRRRGGRVRAPAYRHRGVDAEASRRTVEALRQKLAQPHLAVGELQGVMDEAASRETAAHDAALAAERARMCVPTTTVRDPTMPPETSSYQAPADTAQAVAARQQMGPGGAAAMAAKRTEFRAKPPLNAAIRKRHTMADQRQKQVGVDLGELDQHQQPRRGRLGGGVSIQDTGARVHGAGRPLAKERNPPAAYANGLAPVQARRMDPGASRRVGMGSNTWRAAHTERGGPRERLRLRAQQQEARRQEEEAEWRQRLRWQSELGAGGGGVGAGYSMATTEDMMWAPPTDVTGYGVPRSPRTSVVGHLGEQAEAVARARALEEMEMAQARVEKEYVSVTLGSMDGAVSQSGFRLPAI